MAMWVLDRDAGACAVLSAASVLRDPQHALLSQQQLQLARLHQVALWRRYFGPKRDMTLVRQINPRPQTWADFVRLTGFDGTQSLDDVRAQFGC